MNRRSLLFVLTAGVSGLAGCQGTSISPARDCPPRLDVDETPEEEVTDAGGDVVQYRQLSEKRKREFERALEDENVGLEDTYDAWVSTDFVRYQGRHYAAAVAVC